MQQSFSFFVLKYANVSTLQASLYGRDGEMYQTMMGQIFNWPTSPESTLASHIDLV